MAWDASGPPARSPSPTRRLQQPPVLQNANPEVSEPLKHGPLGFWESLSGEVWVLLVLSAVYHLLRAAGGMGSGLLGRAPLKALIPLLLRDSDG